MWCLSQPLYVYVHVLYVVLVCPHWLLYSVVKLLDKVGGQTIDWEKLRLHDARPKVWIILLYVFARQFFGSIKVEK